MRARRLDAGALMGLGEANSAVGGLPATGSDESKQSSQQQSSKNRNNKQAVELIEVEYSSGAFSETRKA